MLQSVIFWQTCPTARRRNKSLITISWTYIRFSINLLVLISFLVFISANPKFIEVDPQVNKENLRKHIGRQAQDYGAQVVGKARLNADQIKDMTIRVEPVSMERYQQHQKTIDKTIKKIGGVELNFQCDRICHTEML